MKSFGWKRKIGENVVRETSSAFEKEAKDEDDNEVSSGDIDWLNLAPKRRIISLEDAHTKSRRLREEGAVLASAERYWEAVKKWDEAILLTPNDARLYEMKSQAFMQLCEDFPAVHEAEKAVNISPTWWEAYQTLGRAQLGIGEVILAQRNFAKAVHVYPLDEELWEADLRWANSLIKMNQRAKQHELQKRKSTSAKIIELDNEAEKTVGIYTGGATEAEAVSDVDESCNRGNVPEKRLSRNYVHMRYL